jgi:hypothetical protein
MKEEDIKIEEIETSHTHLVDMKGVDTTPLPDGLGSFQV